MNPRGKSQDLLFYETLEKRCELTSNETGWLQTYRKGFAGECLYDELFEDVGHGDVLIYRDLYLQIGRSVTQYDAMVINEEGIVVNEIKNYTGEYKVEGGNWLRNGRGISEEPIAQLNRSLGKLIRMRNDVNGSFKIDGKLIFVSDDFYLQTDDNSIWRKIVVRMDLKRYLRSLGGGIIGNKAQYIVRLISERIVENPYYEGKVDDGRLRKGLYCGNCGSFELLKSRFHLMCRGCGSKESNETHLLRAMSDYQTLFYGKDMTRNSLVEFIGEKMHSKTVSRALLKHCYSNKNGNTTTYKFKYRDLEDALDKADINIKYKDYIRGE